MEAFWIRNFRCLLNRNLDRYRPAVKSLLLGLTSMMMVESVVAETTVDVFIDTETVMVDGDLIKARTAAEDQAFQEAVRQATLPVHSEEKVQEFVKQAKSHVKTWQKLAERKEGNRLFIKFRVEVVVPPSPAHNQAVESGIAVPMRFEIALASKNAKVSSSDLVAFVTESWKSPVHDLRLTRGSIRFEVALAMPLSEAEAQLSQWLGTRGTVRAFEIQSVPVPEPDVLPVPPPTAEPSENPKLKQEIYISPPPTTTPETLPPQMQPSLMPPAFVPSAPSPESISPQASPQPMAPAVPELLPPTIIPEAPPTLDLPAPSSSP